MAQKFTYDDFERELTNSGLGSEFSAADLKLARQNPDAGLSILKYKRDYHAATTPEQRALAKMGADGIRSSYGGYTGGTAGEDFYLTPLSPGSFRQESTQTADRPAYESRYDGSIQELMDEILKREDFRYDPETDPLYGQYRKQYTREGTRAQQEAIGTAAAASGGIPSSYAATAAAQAGDYYAAQMTDKIPELYQLAYNKYMNDYNMKLSDLGVVQGAEQSDYDRYLNELNQYNTDRSFDYQNLLDEINQQTQRRSEELQMAMLAAQYGDYSFLKKLGIDTSAYEAAAGGGSGGGSTGSGSGVSGGTAATGGGSYSENVEMARGQFDGVQRTLSTLLGQGNYDRAYDMALGLRGQMSKRQWADVAKRIYEVSGIKIDDSVKYR